MSGDQYTDADTGVFYNKLGLRSRAELDAAERDITRIRETELAAHPLRATYDLEHLRAVHAHLFSDIYTWAGELRTVSIAKTDLFCLPQYIESQAQQVFRKLAANDCLRDLPPEKFIEGLAHLLGEINAIHPFRDGNGRAQRAIVSQLALDAGHRLDWSHLEPRQNIVASIASFHGKLEPLRELLDQHIIVPQGRSRDALKAQADFLPTEHHRRRGPGGSDPTLGR